ncbi:sentrin-specific protease 6 isoform X2 [Protopterus annectens]|uniref:sentrin-specific protease 6 isoform X2 n=1 Tax=Protopterus annectens TaxID=7888 RepID=UPI001CFA14E4|nr:sentrin-specific protease 6 isoform X2 [Protopterus annectens]
MAGEGSILLKALDRTASQKDGGFKNRWSFSQSDVDNNTTEKDEANLLSVDDESDEACSEDEALKLHTGYHLDPSRLSSESLKTYERRKYGMFRSLKGNPIGLNMLGSSKKLSENVQAVSLSPGTVVQGRIFHHVSAPVSVVKTAAQRKEYPSVQKTDSDHSVLQYPKGSVNFSENAKLVRVESDVKRKIQTKRRHDDQLPDMHLSPITRKSTERIEGQLTSEMNVVCEQCGKKTESITKCQNCRKAVSFTESVGSLQRSPIHLKSSLQQDSLNAGFNTKSFYNCKDIAVSPVTANSVLQQNGKVIMSVAPSTLNRTARTVKSVVAKPLHLNDPIVLSSDEEEENGDSFSTENTNKMDSVSPSPVDSRLPSPGLPIGSPETIFKEHFSDLDTLDSITLEKESKIILPRKARMKDQFGNPVTEVQSKRRKVNHQQQQQNPSNSAPSSSKMESIILECRSVRIGTMRRMVSEPIVFSVDYIDLRLTGSVSESCSIRIDTSMLTKCEWCSTRKLPVVFLQTTSDFCSKLQAQLKMDREDGVWFDSNAANKEERYIILIFENGPDVSENSILEHILTEIGLKNNIPDLFVKLPFEDANNRLVAFTKQFEENIKSPAQKDSKVASESRTHLRSIPAQLQFFDDEKEVEDSHTVFTGPVVKLIVYPPPPSKGGISVTNEDLHCLTEGEFLNDVIIDFYLKYLVLEKLKKQDAERIHIFSSFFYKRLNQRERRNLQETANLSLPQKRHGRVKTWTRHVDLFQKDFIFVPINEAAHWFLAVICFSGFDSPTFVPNPLYQENGAQQQSSTTVSTTTTEQECRLALPSKVDNLLQTSPLRSVVKTSQKTYSKASNLLFVDSSAESEQEDMRLPSSKNFTGRSPASRVSPVDCNVGSPQSAGQKTENRTKYENGMQDNRSTAIVTPKDGLHSIRLNYSDEPADTVKTKGEDFIDFSDEDSDSQDEGIDDGPFAEDIFSPENGQWHLRPTVCKQPCILIMDSLRGPSRSNVVRTLREYLEIEWEVRKGSKRSFSKEVMKGSNPRVPQQDNFSDCGVYVLQYVESFFEYPIPSFELPMNLTNWFPQQRVKKKREEIRDLILKLQEQSEQKKCQKDLSTTETFAQQGSDLSNSSSLD